MSSGLLLECVCNMSERLWHIFKRLPLYSNTTYVCQDSLSLHVTVTPSSVAVCSSDGMKWNTAALLLQDFLLTPIFSLCTYTMNFIFYLCISSGYTGFMRIIRWKRVACCLPQQLSIHIHTSTDVDFRLSWLGLDSTRVSSDDL